MMFNMPTTPFTMRLLPSMGDSNPDLMEKMRSYALSRYGRPRAEVEAEIDERLGVKNGSMSGEPAEAVSTPAMSDGVAPAQKKAGPKKSFLEKWKERKAAADAEKGEKTAQPVISSRPAPVKKPMPAPSAPVAPAQAPVSAPMSAPTPAPVSRPAPAPRAPQSMTNPVSRSTIKPVQKSDPGVLRVPRKPAPAPVPEPAPVAPAPMPEPKPAPAAQTTQNADETVFRWR
jgi:hypothetical protein